jgi:hypothetical protein
MCHDYDGGHWIHWATNLIILWENFRVRGLLQSVCLFGFTNQFQPWLNNTEVYFWVLCKYLHNTQQIPTVNTHLARHVTIRPITMIPIRLWVQVRFCLGYGNPNPYPYPSIPISGNTWCYPYLSHALHGIRSMYVTSFFLYRSQGCLA